MASESSDEEEEILLLIMLRRRQQQRRERSVWVWQIFAKRRQQGEYHYLFMEMRLFDPESHFMYTRMSKEIIDSLLAKVYYVFTVSCVDLP